MVHNGIIDGLGQLILSIQKYHLFYIPQLKSIFAFNCCYLSLLMNNPRALSYIPTSIFLYQL